jgi:hypothetical protein
MRMQIMFEMFLYFGSYRYAICIKFWDSGWYF